ncbi:MAG: 6-phospho-beta-glucosidase [Fusobacteriaceae bacterium]
MKKKLKIVTIGGGSSYTPEIIEGFIKRYSELPISELWLVDIEDGEEKLEIVGNLAKRMVEKANLKNDFKIYLTLDRKVALKDADFVITQFRVGLLEARIRDEKIPLRYGMIGQETNGAGGFAKALRTIPVILDICKDITELCPEAWLVNFTNPSGMVTEAVIKYYPKIKIAGLCNVPIGVRKSVVEALKAKDSEVELICGGLNHFFWGRKVLHNGIDKTKEAVIGVLEDIENSPANIKMREPWLKEQIMDLGMIPCAYHRYYYLTDEMLRAQIADVKSGKGTRGEQVKIMEKELFELYKDPNLKEKPKQLEQRGGQYYSDAACELINSIYNDKGTIIVVSTKNNGIIDCLPNNCAVEVSAKIYKDGIKPFSQESMPLEARGLLQLMKCFEEMTIEAAVTGNYQKAIHALTLNPLVNSGNQVKTMFDEIIRENWDYLPKFHHAISKKKY